MAQQSSKKAIKGGGSASDGSATGPAGKMRRLSITGARLCVLILGFIAALTVTVFAYLQPPRPDPYALPALTGSTTAWWDWFSHPLEDNSAFRLPSVDADLRSVAALADGKQGWAAGMHGTILTTQDGGQSWTSQPSGTTSDLMSMTMLDDGQSGWAIGGNGTILTTKDGGKTWQAQVSGTQSVLTAITMLADGQRGWLVGDRGLILMTKDGGRTWQPQVSNVQAELTAITMLADGQSGWIIGMAGTILLTNDGGQTWRLQTAGGESAAQVTKQGIQSSKADAPAAQQSILGTRYFLTAIAMMADGYRGWLVGGNGLILMTNDGGQSWQPLTSNTAAQLNAIAMLTDGQRGWTVGDNGTILVTNDGGQSWLPQASGTQASLTAVTMLEDGRHGWVLGGDGTILATADGGQTWLPRLGGAKVRLSALTLSADARHGWAVGGDGIILATQDQGRTWQQQYSGTLSQLNSITLLADGQQGWAVGRDGTILMTKNGGQTWQKIDSGTPAELFAISMLPDGRRGWVVGEGDTILISKDGGQTWQPRTSGTPVGLLAISTLPDGSRNWIAGDDGTILLSTDGDQVWQRQPTGLHEWLNAIVMHADGLHGWAAGLNGTILATADGGQSWAPRTSSVKTTLTAATMLADGQQGRMVGESGIILATKDGGLTWEPQTSGTKANLTSIAMLDDGRTGMVVGDQDTVLTTQDGGQTWASQVEYRRSPGPWLYVSWIAIGAIAFMIILFVRPKIDPEFFGIAAEIAADAPAESLDADRLAFRPIVETLAKFLRNTGTRPPLTLSIDGEWGSGKSSLMRMLRGELTGLGFAAVWFNPWHHQKEDILLAALLQHVRAEGVPPIIQPLGIRYRLRLWLRRMSYHPYAAALILFGVVTPVLYFYAHHPDEGYQSYFTKVVTPTLNLLGVIIPPKTENLGSIVNALADCGLWMTASFLVASSFLINALRSFPLLPAALLATINSKASADKAQLQTDYRRRFGETFGDVTWALKPRHMVIFIDDLDRCAPEKALECLEATNYLATNGACFIILGMARARVERLIGLASEKLAAEMAETEGERATNKQQSDLPRRLRRNYARRYLDKLVQLNIRVPTADIQKLISLLGVLKADTMTSPKRDRRQILARLWQRSRFAVYVPLMMVAAIYIGTTQFLPNPAPLHPPEGAEATDKPAGKNNAATANPSTTITAPPVTTGLTGNSAIKLAYSGATGTLTEPLMGHSPIYFLPIMLLIGAAATFAYRLLRRDDIEIAETDVFMHTLSDWDDVVTSRQQSPRSIKLFGNLARYTAMMLLEENRHRLAVRSTSLLEQWIGRVTLLLKKDAATSPAPSDGSPEEAAKADDRDRYAVALSAIYHARPDLLENEENSILGHDWQQRLQSFLDSDIEEEAARRAEIAKTLKAEAGEIAPNAAAPTIDAKEIDLRVAQDPDLREDLRRLRLRHEAAVEIGHTLAQRINAGFAWPPPRDVVDRFRLFVIGAVEAERADEPGSRAP